MTVARKWTPPARIRAIAIAIILNQDRLLVFEGYNLETKAAYWRPLGGGIEFGERGEDALRRELHEEIGQEIANIEYIETIENLYTLDGVPGHELVRIYSARLVDERAYRQSWVIEEPGELPQQAYWKSLAELAEKPELLKPEGLWQLLTELGLLG